MRYFKIPSAIALHQPDGSPVLLEDGKPAALVFAEVIAATVANDAKLGASVSALRVSDNLLRAIEGKPAGAVASLSDSDWEIVKGVTESPTNPYATHVARQALPFFDAILEAKTDVAKLPQ